MAEPAEDPGAAWEQTRLRWLTPRKAESSSDEADDSAGDDALQRDKARRGSSPGGASGRRRRGRTRDAQVEHRLSELESLLRAGYTAEQGTTTPRRPAATTPLSSSNAPTGSSSAGAHGGTGSVLHQDEFTTVVTEGTGASTTTASAACRNTHKGKQPSLDGDEELEPDGGVVIRDRAKDELRRASESILLAFKQARPLKEPLPLSLVTSLLYRSWLIDGTIPPDYVPDPPPPDPRVTAGTAYASRTLLPSSAASSGPPPPPPAEPVPVPPPVPALDGPQEKMRVDMLRGARWRTEKEVASGSDVM